jgi:inward rectifier potassium channel
MASDQKSRKAKEPDIVIVNAQSTLLGDLYHVMLRMQWWAVLAAIALLFLATNLAFALAYLATGGVAHAEPGSFADAFFFSVQTLGSVGYGAMYPATRAANLVMTVESFAAVCVTAISTGLVFAKFSRPTARLAFSRHVTVFTMDKQPTLAFRVANERGNYVLEAQIRVSLVRRERTAEGMSFYRMYDLRLARDRSPALGRSWTITHRIDADSPLRGMTAELLARDDAQLIVTLLGMDGTSTQTIYARHEYNPEDVVYGKRHADMLTDLPRGRLQLDYARFHDLVPAPLE